MKIEVYVLGLLKFEDDRIVFDDDELEIIAKRIGDCLGKCLGNETSLVGKPEEMGGYYVYPLEKCKNQELVLDKNKSKSVTIELAQIGYYHHRVIMHFRLNSESSLDFSTLRDARKKTEQIADLPELTPGFMTTGAVLCRLPPVPLSRELFVSRSYGFSYQ